MSQRTPSPKDRDLMRRLMEQGGLEHRGDGDLSPEQARELRRLQGVWDAIEPPPDRLPPGFTGRVMARVHETAGGRGESLTGAPLWVRSTAAAALVLGLAGGLLMGRLPSSQSAPAPVEIAESLDAEWLDTAPSLAESYLAMLEEPEALTEGGETP